jgi:hypothetical protein
MQDIPIELIVHHVLPHLNCYDKIRLTLANKYFNSKLEVFEKVDVRLSLGLQYVNTNYFLHQLAYDSDDYFVKNLTGHSDIMVNENIINAQAHVGYELFNRSITLDSLGLDGLYYPSPNWYGFRGLNINKFKIPFNKEYKHVMLAATSKDKDAIFNVIYYICK